MPTKHSPRSLTATTTGPNPGVRGSNPLGGTTDLLKRVRLFNRIAIAGGPKAGKTSLASELADRQVYHTDDFKELSWKDQPGIIIQLLKDKSRFVVEGIQVARALRKGLEVDIVIFIKFPKVELNGRQEGMRKMVDKDWYAVNRTPVLFLE